MTIEDIKNSIYSVVDFPKRGIIFRDITPIFYDYEKVDFIINKIADFVKIHNIDVIVAPESRGFLIGLPLSIKLKKPFIPIRKQGKLPREVVSIQYDLEYGSSILEIHKDSIKENQRVLIVDDLIATGGTSLAIEQLINKLKGKVVAQAYLIELENLCDKKKLSGDFFSLIRY